MFPTDEEDDGMARMSWRGPPAIVREYPLNGIPYIIFFSLSLSSQERYQFTAVAMILEYLSDSPVAPLQARLVEVPEPYCAEISQSVYENSETCVGFSFSGVPTEQLSILENK